MTAIDRIIFATAARPNHNFKVRKRTCCSAWLKHPIVTNVKRGVIFTRQVQHEKNNNTKPVGTFPLSKNLLPRSVFDARFAMCKGKKITAKYNRVQYNTARYNLASWCNRTERNGRRRPKSGSVGRAASVPPPCLLKSNYSPSSITRVAAVRGRIKPELCKHLTLFRCGFRVTSYPLFLA